MNRKNTSRCRRNPTTRGVLFEIIQNYDWRKGFVVWDMVLSRFMRKKVYRLWLNEVSRQ